MSETTPHYHVYRKGVYQVVREMLSGDVEIDPPKMAVDLPPVAEPNFRHSDITDVQSCLSDILSELKQLRKQNREMSDQLNDLKRQTSQIKPMEEMVSTIHSRVDSLYHNS